MYIKMDSLVLFSKIPETISIPFVEFPGDINNYFITNFNYYLISKEIIYVGALYTAFLTISKIK